MSKIDSLPLPEALKQQIINTNWIDCADLHEGTCLGSAIIRFLELCKKSYKYYIPIHLIPFLIFKLKKLRQRYNYNLRSPTKTISVAFYHYVKSVIFVSLYVGICKYMLCKFKNIRLRVDWLNPTLAASVACTALQLESESRRQEIALFIFPKALETAWNLLKKRGYVNTIKNWELLLFGFAMGIINYFYQHDSDSIKSTYLSIFKRFWGVD